PVRYEVKIVLESNRKPQEIRRRKRRRPLDRRAVLDQAFSAAQARRLREELERGCDRTGVICVAADLHREHRAEIRHLFLCDGLPGMRWEAGVVHRFHILVAGEEGGEALSVGTLWC